MMLGVGAGAAAAGIFHLSTHAFFKALLFMAAGSVIHATHRQDMWELGGLGRRMPVTFAAFLCGAAALAGLPPFSGFWSKDEILLQAFHTSPVLFGLGLFGAFLTAFYMTRLGIVTFLGKPRTEGEAQESPRVMTWPMIVLAAGAVGLGWLGTPWANWFHGFLAGEAGGHASIEPLGLPLMVVSVAVAAAGIALGHLMYGTGALPPAVVASRLRPLYSALKRKYWMDELYDAALVRPGIRLALLLRRVDEGGVDGTVNGVGQATIGTSWLSNVFDHVVVDGLVNLVGWLTRQAGGVGRFIQTGFAQDYMFWLAAGAVVLILVGWLGP